MAKYEVVIKDSKAVDVFDKLFAQANSVFNAVIAKAQEIDENFDDVNLSKVFTAVVGDDLLKDSPLTKTALRNILVGYYTRPIDRQVYLFQEGKIEDIPTSLDSLYFKGANTATMVVNYGLASIKLNKNAMLPLSEVSTQEFGDIKSFSINRNSKVYEYTLTIYAGKKVVVA